MPIMIPEAVERAMDFLGLKWININEDAVAELGDQVLTFTTAIDTFCESVGDAIQVVADVSESDALNQYAILFQDTRTEYLTPVNDAVAAAAPICGDVADGIRTYKLTVLGVAIVQAAALAASGPFAGAVRLLAKEAIEEIIDIAVSHLMATVVDAINQEIEENVIQPINQFATGAIQKVTRPVAEVIVEATPEINASVTVKVPKLVCDIMDIETCVSNVQDAYGELEAAWTALLDWHAECDYLTPTAIPDLATSGMFKGILDNITESVSSEIGLMAEGVLEKLTGGIMIVFEKYCDADVVMQITASEVLQGIEFPPMQHPFLVPDRDAPPAVELVPDVAPVETGAAESNASNNLTTYTVGTDAVPVMTGVAQSDASHNLTIYHVGAGRTA